MSSVLVAQKHLDAKTKAIVMVTDGEGKSNGNER